MPSADPGHGGRPGPEQRFRTRQVRGTDTILHRPEVGVVLVECDGAARLGSVCSTGDSQPQIGEETHHCQGSRRKGACAGSRATSPRRACAVDHDPRVPRRERERWCRPRAGRGWPALPRALSSGSPLTSTDGADRCRVTRPTGPGRLHGRAVRSRPLGHDDDRAGRAVQDGVGDPAEPPVDATADHQQAGFSAEAAGSTARAGPSTVCRPTATSDGAFSRAVSSSLAARSSYSRAGSPVSNG